MFLNEFVQNVDACYRFSYPNVVKIFGGSHLHDPFVAVFENALSTNLWEYLSQRQNKHAVWRKLFEVSLGLKYLIERGIAIDNLRCDAVWIGTDGLAKIYAFGCLVDGAHHVRWQAPELLRGEASSIKSSIYSLGMCILKPLLENFLGVAKTRSLCRTRWFSASDLSVLEE